MFVKKLVLNSSQKNKLPPITGGLKASEVDPCFVGHYGIPKASTAFAFDSVNGIFALATRDGKIKLFGENEAQVLLETPRPSSCRILHFLENEKILLNVTLEDNIEVWDVEEMKLCHVYHCRAITAASIIQGSPFMYIGDARGNIFVLKFEQRIKQVTCMQYSIPVSITYGFVNMQGDDASIVCTLPQPSAELNRLLVGYKNGLLILWGLHENKVLATFYTKDHDVKEKEISSVCWTCLKGSKVAVGLSNGDIWLLAAPDLKLQQKKSNAKESDYTRLHFSLISKLQVSNEKAKVPPFSLKWHRGNGSWGYLYICGGGDSASLNMIKVLNLDDASGRKNENMRKLEIALPDAVKDVSVISSVHTTNQRDGEILLVLTKAGHLYSYSNMDIKATVDGIENLSVQPQLTLNMIKPVFAESSISVTKIFNIDSSNTITQMNGTFMQILPCLMKLSPKETHPANTLLPKIRSWYITGHKNGSIQIWDVSTPCLFSLFTIKARSNVEATVRGCRITAIDFCPSSGLLSVADQLGMVQIFKITSGQERVKTQSKNCQDIMKVGSVKICEGSISCISIDDESTYIAVGCDEGSVAVINAKTCTLLFNFCFFASSSSSIVSLQFRNLLTTGSMKLVLFAAAKDASVIAINPITGESFSSFVQRPKHQATSIFMHIPDFSVRYESAISNEKQSSLSSVDHTEANDRPCNIASDLMVLCSENCIWLYSALAITQGTKKVYSKEKLRAKCCWASTFQNTMHQHALFLLFETGEIEIRSLPELMILKTTTLNECSLSNLEISAGLLKSLSLSPNGRLVMIDADQEQSFVSFLKEDSEYRLSGSNIQVCRKEAQDFLQSSKCQESKNSAFKSLLGIKNSKSKTSSTAVHKSNEKCFSVSEISELSNLFSTRNFPAVATGLDTDSSPELDAEQLDIDDIDIDDSEYSPSKKTETPGKQSVVNRLQRKLKDKAAKMRTKVVGKSNVTVEQSREEDEAKVRTIEEIKSTYGQLYPKHNAIYQQTKARLQENQIKLQGINDHVAEMQTDAQNFQSAAEELLRQIKEKNI
eukprot:TRINITY_DN3564_c1_g2_i1.p1 TRINITY_DN3564_c1_g2~~TRINITY_DN3564_c1_g2_i1.p1  ORF type:complete len:1052 (-),score=221.66 TRINITY_DN3564_c1_g2_i1:564-3719(-)